MQSETCAQVEMPRYKCHKIVHALKIDKLKPPMPAEQGGSGLWAIVPLDIKYAPFTVSDEYMRKHHPQPGGYYVVYADGYKSFSPADAFEDGYTRLP